MSLAFKTGDYVELKNSERGHIVSVRRETNEILVSVDEYTYSQVPFSEICRVNDNNIIVIDYE